jgi:hypothetical protein
MYVCILPLQQVSPGLASMNKSFIWYPSSHAKIILHHPKIPSFFQLLPDGGSSKASKTTNRKKKKSFYW